MRCAGALLWASWAVGRVCWSMQGVLLQGAGGCVHEDFPRFLPWANLALGLLLLTLVHEDGSTRHCRHAWGTRGDQSTHGSSAWAAMASRYWGKPLEVDAGGRRAGV